LPHVPARHFRCGLLPLRRIQSLPARRWTLWRALLQSCVARCVNLRGGERVDRCVALLQSCVALGEQQLKLLNLCLPVCQCTPQGDDLSWVKRPCDVPASRRDRRRIRPHLRKRSCRGRHHCLPCDATRRRNSRRQERRRRRSSRVALRRQHRHCGCEHVGPHCSRGVHGHRHRGLERACTPMHNQWRKSSTSKG